VRDEIIEFEDGVSGPKRFDAARALGDFVIAKADGTPAYQLAVVVDDAEMGITDIVRGDDLLDSTSRQILIYRALGMTGKIPRYYHLPLIVGPDRLRLAKRHGDSRLCFYRDRGVTADRIVNLLARWCGIDASAASLRPHDLIHSFRLEALPKMPIVFGPGDERWLTGDYPSRM
jgi:glutamyl-tRNA synthetase